MTLSWEGKCENRKITFAKNGDPLMFLSPKRTEILYSPGAVGR